MSTAKKVAEYDPTDDAELSAYQDRKNRRNSPAWRPEKGDVIKAECIGRKLTPSDYPTPSNPEGLYPVITYKVLYSNKPDVTPVGSVIALHAFHTVVRNRLAELLTIEGSVQWISYDGENVTNATKGKDIKDQISYHAYDVENDGQVEEEKPFAF